MKIILPGEPIPQARMKHARRGNFISTYDPNAKQKEFIRQILKTYPKETTPDFPRISFLFHMPIPKSVRKRDLALYQSGTLKHDKRPDIDNLIKLYLDCLDGIILDGDQKVSLGPSIKVYHPEPKSIIWINETEKQITPWELDVAFLDVSELGIQSFCERDYPCGFESPWLRVRQLFLESLNPSYQALSSNPLGHFPIDPE